MPMKVTVCFDRVKVLVPCGDGELLVKELIKKSITRYKKATGKSTDDWVSVITLRTISEGSILDPDDTLSDVVDDREQLIADFEEQGGPSVPHNGDGQSASSAGTASPDIFQVELSHGGKVQHQHGYSFDGGNDVIVTANDISSGSRLTVRRGSEPTLNVLEENAINNNNNNNSNNNNNNNKVTVNGPFSEEEKLNWKNKDAGDPSQDEDHKPVIHVTPGQREKTPPFSRFARDSWRQSLGNQPNMFKWLEAQERQEDKYKQPERTGPVGGATSPGQEGESTEKVQKPKGFPPLPSANRPREVGILICLTNDGTPLGIHVVPDFDEDGRESGLMVQSIEPGGRIDQDGRVKMQDRIIHINNFDLHAIPFARAQEIFRNAMKTDEVCLKVVKHSVPPPKPKKSPPSLLPKPRGHSPMKPSPLTLSSQPVDSSSPQPSPLETSTPNHQSQTRYANAKDSVSQSKSLSSISSHTQPIRAVSPVKPGSPGKRAPPAPPTRHPSTTLSSSSTTNGTHENKSNDDASETASNCGTLTKNREAIIAPTNTKKIGKRVTLELIKSEQGLGFSVTTRDNTTGGPSPIYIKNILPKGAAVSDGRLKAGDRLLEVNGVEMTGKTQGDAVSVLRNTAMGSKVVIVVSRQEVEEDERFKVPRELPLADADTTPPDQAPDLFQPLDKSGDDGTLAVMRNKELIELYIALNDTGSAGLGVSVKGKTLTTEEGTRDLGIFVKAVIHGGAASKDGRLQVNDQLLEVNHASLVNCSNIESMDILRQAMQADGPMPGHINIKVARRIGAPSPSPFTSPGNHEHVEDMDELGTSEDHNNVSLDKTVTNENGDMFDSPIRTQNGGIPNFSNFKSPNVFLDRIMAGNGLRNESYNRATHDSYAETPQPRRNVIDLTKQKPRPHSTLGIERGSPGGSNSSSSEDLNQEPAWLKGPDWSRHASQTSAEDSEMTPTGDGFSRDGFGRQSMSEKRKGHGDPRGSEVYQKAKGVKDLYKGGLGQQRPVSGSYGRLIRAGSAESLLSGSNSNLQRKRDSRHDRMATRSGIRGPAPPTNLKRFSSLENLSTVPAADPGSPGDTSGSPGEEDEVPSSPQPRMARRRGGNESFRCAVDRSYDPVPQLDMDPPRVGEETGLIPMRRSRSVEEESSEGGSIGRDPSNSARSSVSDNVFTEEKKKGGKKQKEARRSGGLLKGFFKFGRGRKTPVEDLHKDDGGHDGGHDSREGSESQEEHREHREHEEQMWRQAQAEQERYQEQHRRLQEQQHFEQQKQRQNQQHQHQTNPQQQPHQSYNPFPYGPAPPAPHSMGHSAPAGMGGAIGGAVGGATEGGKAGLTRAEKIQQLRADHQRRHQERKGHYPQEEREEEYERQIQEDEQKAAAPRFTPADISLQRYGQSAIPSQLEGPGVGSRPASRPQVERPRSRGVQDTGMGTSNYTDYSDMYQHGNRHVSDSNVTKYSYVRPPSRGASADHSNYQYQHAGPYDPAPNSVPRGPTPSHGDLPPTGLQRGPTPSHGDLPPSGLQRGPTPSHDRHIPQHAPIPRGPTPSYDYERSGGSYPSGSNISNYHVTQRGPSPANTYGDRTQRGPSPANTHGGDRRHFQDTDLRRSNNAVNPNIYSRHNDNLTRQQEVPPPSAGGQYGMYRDPVYTSMAGKRPVKSLTSQPNSAKV